MTTLGRRTRLPDVIASAEAAGYRSEHCLHMVIPDGERHQFFVRRDPGPLRSLHLTTHTAQRRTVAHGFDHRGYFRLYSWRDVLDWLDGEW